MYLKIEMYALKCDNCGKSSGDDADYSCWDDKQQALNEAQEDGWTQEGEKHYCPECHHYDEEDNLVIKVIEVEVKP